MPFELVGYVQTVFDRVAGASVPVWLTAFGFLLLLAGLVGLGKIIALPPEKTPTFLKFITSVLFVCGVLFAAAGPTMAYRDLSTAKIIKVSPAEAMARLRSNAEVRWLIRLIVYDPLNAAGKNIGNLTKLGPDVDYTFVAPYEELKGYRVSEALEMIGAKPKRELQRRYRVSAIIFPVISDIYPANARGFLRVVKMLEDALPESKTTVSIYPDLDQAQVADLSTQGSLAYYSFDYFKNNYKKYCQIMQNLRCAVHESSDPDSKPRGVLGQISRLSRDWHPIGASLKYADGTCKSNPTICDPCINKHAICEVATWDEIMEFVKPNFGARIFLIQNKPLDDLGQRYLLDVGPSDLIPEIGVD